MIFSTTFYGTYLNNGGLVPGQIKLIIFYQALQQT